MNHVARSHRGNCVSVLGMAALLVVFAAPATGQAADTLGFDHAQHAKLFPSCQTCHAGGGTTDAAMFPRADGCANCHDGVVAARVNWQPRTSPWPTNLTFEHTRHRAEFEAAASRLPGGRAPICADCHESEGAGWMHVQRAVITQCFDCHQIPTEHLAAPDSTCAVCHLPLAEARTLTDARIKAFGEPPSHHVPGFDGSGPTGHGALAQPTANSQASVAASCATCHARNFCIECHVNAPETPTIQALALDPRSLLMQAKLEAPASHRSASFEQTHGAEAGRDGLACATCHTQESCAVCHAAILPRAAAALPAAGPGRAVGAETVGLSPQSHTGDFEEHHASLADATPTACASCHVRTMCLECHRPDAGGGRGFHPTGFLASHPSAAYTRQSSCSDCHNQQQFCVTCHAQAGLDARGQLALGGNYHDAKGSFLLGHGHAARQNLESCVSCHVERDCLTCHSAFGGRRFNPHGPGFDPERLRRKNPELCTACHGVSIPGN